MGTPIRSRAVHNGLNHDTSAFDDDKYVRCSRCGWINNLDQAVHFPEGFKAGWGIRFDETSSGLGTAYDELNVQYDQAIYYDGTTYPDYTIDDPVVTGGCAQCGTFLYNK